MERGFLANTLQSSPDEEATFYVHCPIQYAMSALVYLVAHFQ